MQQFGDKAMNARTFAAVALAGLAALGAGTMAHAAPIPPRVNLHALLSGGAVVPGPGSVGGGGRFSAVLVQDGRQLCYDLVLTGGVVATSAAIHVGRPVVADKAVVPLAVPDAEGSATGCVAVSGGNLARHLAFFPDDYYVEVASAEFPQGAVRGQLWKDGMEPAGQARLPVSPRVNAAMAASASR